jgi:hypothetical protein
VVDLRTTCDKEPEIEGSNLFAKYGRAAYAVYSARDPCHDLQLFVAKQEGCGLNDIECKWLQLLCYRVNSVLYEPEDIQLSSIPGNQELVLQCQTIRRQA